MILLYSYSPNADLTKEREVREWHYEEGLFPPEVSITHYNAIHLDRLRPDVIYIHNPYDYANLLTFNYLLNYDLKNSFISYEYDTNL